MEKNKVFLLKNANSKYAVNSRHLSGIFRILPEEAKISLSFLGVKTAHDGKYVFVIISDGVSECFDIGLRPFEHTLPLSKSLQPAPDIEAGLFFVTDDLFDPVMCYKKNNDERSANDFTYRAKAVFNSTKTQASTETHTDFVFRNEKYDDEVVATQNYYELDNNENDNLFNAFNQSEKEKDGENKDVSQDSVETISIKSEEFEEFKRTITGDSSNQNSTEKAEFDKYYESVKEELDNIFTTFPEEENLEKLVPNSKWAKIDYFSDKFYVVGICYENGTEKYICYGVPTINSYSPPDDLKGFCSFIPLSVFDTSGRGFWVMFQDAKTGKCVKPTDE